MVTLEKRARFAAIQYESLLSDEKAHWTTGFAAVLAGARATADRLQREFEATLQDQPDEYVDDFGDSWHVSKALSRRHCDFGCAAYAYYSNAKDEGLCASCLAKICTPLAERLKEAQSATTA